MKKITKKTREITEVYNILTSAKLSKLETQEKFAVVRTANSIKAVAEGMEAFEKDARKRLEPENFEGLIAQAKRFSELTDEEKAKTNKELMDYDRAIHECVSEEAETEKEVEVQQLGETGLGRLMESNPDWTCAQISTVMDFMGD